METEMDVLSGTWKNDYSNYSYIFRQTFRGLPKELEDAARIDGLGEFRIFLEIMMPLIKPTLITVLLTTPIENRRGDWIVSDKNQFVLGEEQTVHNRPYRMQDIFRGEIVSGRDFCRSRLFRCPTRSPCLC